MFYVYMLLDPRDQEPRYVGLTQDPKKRMYGHANDITCRSRPGARKKQRSALSGEKQRWTKELRDLGLKPLMSVLEIHHNLADGVEAESRCKWMLKYVHGCNLVNIGMGYPGSARVNSFDDQLRGYSFSSLDSDELRYVPFRMNDVSDLLGPPPSTSTNS